MKIILAGGTGFVGSALLEFLLQQKHHVVLLTRNPNRKYANSKELEIAKWDGVSVGDWSNHIPGADVVINLSGEGIANKRWSTIQKEKLLSSRIDSTRVLVKALNESAKESLVFINASAVGYYGPTEKEVDESAGGGDDFLANMCAHWEDEALKIKLKNIRVVLLRIGVVLERGGGALEKFLPMFKAYVGGPLGSGRQWFPWIHREDILRIIQFAMENKGISGPINLTSPNPVTMKQFCKALAKQLKRPCLPPVPSFVLRVFLGEMSTLMTQGQKAIPQKLIQAGFQFKHPNIQQALNSIL